MGAVLVAGAKEPGGHAWRSETVGWKALGISDLPPRWVPRFFVLTAELHRQWVTTGCEEDETKPFPIDSNILKRALAAISASKCSVLIRSSGVTEDFESRGRFESRLVGGDASLVRETAATIWRLVNTLQEELPGQSRAAMP